MLKLVTGEGEALSRSVCEMMPISLPSCMTGARRMCSFLNSASASWMGVSDETEITGCDILSPTNMVILLVQPAVANSVNRIAGTLYMVFEEASSRFQREEAHYPLRPCGHLPQIGLCRFGGGRVGVFILQTP